MHQVQFHGLMLKGGLQSLSSAVPPIHLSSFLHQPLFHPFAPCPCYACHLLASVSFTCLLPALPPPTSHHISLSHFSTLFPRSLLLSTISPISLPLCILLYFLFLTFSFFFRPTHQLGIIKTEVCRGTREAELPNVTTRLLTS